MALKIHFLNVGHGDCTVIEHPSGRLSVIDINNGTELDSSSAEELAKAYQLSDIARLFDTARKSRPVRSRIDGERRYRDYVRSAEEQAGRELAIKGYDIALTNPIEYLRDTYPNHNVHRYVQSHPDMDHMRGLTALDEAVNIINFWDTEHEKEPEDFVSERDEADWSTYQKLAKGDGVTVLRYYRGSSGIYYNQEPAGVSGGDNIEILAPTKDIIAAATEASNYNNLSYVLRITYKGIRIILGGDAEKEVWDDLAQRYGEDLKCHVLKASHHGRDSGYHQEAVKLMSPEFTIVSVGTKPETDASNKYRNYSGHVWSTRWKGNITLTVNEDGRAVIGSEYDR